VFCGGAASSRSPHPPTSPPPHLSNPPPLHLLATACIYIRPRCSLFDGALFHRSTLIFLRCSCVELPWWSAAMEAPQLRQSKEMLERRRSPAQTSSRGTPRFKRPVHTPSPTKLQYGDAFLITTVDGQHCLCPNLFDASIYLIPMRFVKESGFFPLCCFTFDRMQKPGSGLLQDSAASDGAQLHRMYLRGRPQYSPPRLRPIHPV